MQDIELSFNEQLLIDRLTGEQVSLNRQKQTVERQARRVQAEQQQLDVTVQSIWRGIEQAHDLEPNAIGTTYRYDAEQNKLIFIG